MYLKTAELPHLPFYFLFFIFFKIIIIIIKIKYVVAFVEFFQLTLFDCFSMFRNFCCLRGNTQYSKWSFRRNFLLDDCDGIESRSLVLTC
jgi:hypothetical protein